MALALITPNATPIITDQQAQDHCKVDSSADLALVQLYRDAAVESVKRALRRELLESTYELLLDDFPCNSYGVYYSEIALPLPPCKQVDSVKYIDPDGTLQTLSSTKYQVDVKSIPARVVPAYGETWPTTKTGTINAVVIRFVAGWANAAAIPAPIRAAILLRIATLYANREELTIGHITAMLEPGIQGLISPWVNRWVT